MSERRVRLIGATGSPYTRKMSALLRYRHVPHNTIWGQPEVLLPKMGIEVPKPSLLPTFLLEDEQGETKAVCDSTPLIRRLEQDFSGRSVLPANPVLAFIDYLLEDFGDEWVTKYMFHYRWHLAEDADNAGTQLPFMMGTAFPDDTHQNFKTFFSERQIGRLYVVGSNDVTAPIIDASYRRFLTVMEAHLKTQNCMLGERPGAGDFAIFGQLTQLVGFDLTPRAIAHELSPRTVAWVYRMEDMSGLEPEEDDWNKPDAIPETLRGILCEIGRMYVPAQLANDKAVQAGDKTWQAEIDGALWQQPTFPYQAKCLKWLREVYWALSDVDRAQVDGILSGTGVLDLFTGDSL